MQKEFVIKSNDIIRNFSYDYTETEYKAIAYVCSVYKQHEKDVEQIETYRFSILIQDFIKACGLDLHGGSAYFWVRKIFETLEKKSKWISVYDKDGKEWTTNISWISKCYFDKKDRIEFYADRDLYWFVCGLENRFTSYELKMYMSMNGKHALRLYEILKSYESVKGLNEDIDTLKKLLAVQGKVKYEKTGKFIKEVIAPAVEEINNKTDLKITFSQVMTKNKITGINFKISKEKRIIA